MLSEFFALQNNSKTCFTVKLHKNMGFIENFGKNWATFGQTEPYFWEKLKTEAEKLRVSEGRASYVLPKSAPKKKPDVILENIIDQMKILLPIFMNITNWIQNM